MDSNLCPYCRQLPRFIRKGRVYDTCNQPKCKSQMRSVKAKQQVKKNKGAIWKPSDNYNSKKRAANDKPDLQITRVKRMIEGELRTVTIYAPKPPKRHKKTPSGMPEGVL